MKLSEYIIKVMVKYNKMLLPIIGNTIVWFGLDAISRYQDRFILYSGYSLTSLMWIVSIVLVEIDTK